MTTQPPDPAGHTTHHLAAFMPPAFWEFQARYDRACLEYARIHLGDAAEARRLVDSTFLYLATIWFRLEAMPNPGADAWALFKQRVHGELAVQGLSPATTETLAFARALRAASEPLLDSFRADFHAEYGAEIAELEEGLGLYRQMTKLSERQFDVLILHDALGFDTKETALIMGIQEATVRSTRRTAKHRIAAAMGLPLDDTLETDALDDTGKE
ncbi:sigma-70 family RNA polymerase sigma factor [Streptomyces triticiradicis]|uniref:Sigma-70 family RNA polymerase sigma factor n=1 Tax=Streptomyces triticiradicis TaxID=2651189 RepID=A0A7J5D1H5_9ACTN|nr:sigma-70 family RNA polymerase sigma factor [Streptomyces triticiradicis]KAB1976838.1 sigma-70 family RNA polymerase sigma factor [Streptomyces triticiradicis]